MRLIFTKLDQLIEICDKSGRMADEILSIWDIDDIDPVCGYIYPIGGSLYINHRCEVGPKAIDEASSVGTLENFYESYVCPRMKTGSFIHHEKHEGP